MDSHIIRRAKLRSVNPHRWIQDVVEGPNFHPGAFARKAKRAGKTTKKLMAAVLAHPEAYDEVTRHQAIFMHNALSRD
jgi:hypothetical protein